MKSDPLISYRRSPANLDRSLLEAFAEILRERVARGREFHCLITTDAELQSMNRDFRGKDYPTDVLSFPGEEDYLGDIAISLQRARAQAREYGHALEDEIRVLMLHGVLHLKGMDHETDSGEMARAESRWRKKLGLPGGLIERVA
ncbi:MAG TPA: rRNA maturation RNase YbeY [Bryobacteraceae bacterium]|jgi:probable rRNA maturation factor|nr:rRNA maturation RNase YbeY [Bryobacteraceae bacterium]